MKPKMVPLPNFAFDYKHMSSRADALTIMNGKVESVHGKGRVGQSLQKSSETALWATNNNEMTSCGHCLRARKEIDMLVQQLSHTEEVYEMLYDKTQAENAQKEAHLAQLNKNVSSLQKRLKSLKATNQPRESVAARPTRKPWNLQQDVSDKQVQVCIQIRKENSEYEFSVAACKTEETLSSQVLTLESELAEQKRKLTRTNYEVDRLERDIETWKSVAQSAQEAVVASKTEVQQLKRELESEHDRAKSSNACIASHIASIAVQTMENLDLLVHDRQMKDSSTQSAHKQHTDVKLHTEYNAAMISLCADLNALAKDLLSECTSLEATHLVLSSLAAIAQQQSVSDHAFNTDNVSADEERNENDLVSMRLHAQKLEEQLNGLAQVNR